MRIFLPFTFFFFFNCITFPLIESSVVSRQEYLELIKRYPSLIQPLGDFTKGEIQIVVDPAEMAAIEKLAGRDVGLIKQDNYWLWINDACIFPSGFKGVYGRILWSKTLTSTPGVIVMPVMPNGKIVLNCNFRHATRSWEIELPRGGLNPGEEIEAAAKRETLEETGMIIDQLSLLGEVTSESGLTNGVVPVFLASVSEKQAVQQEETEAIEKVLSLTLTEIKHSFLQGYFVCNIRGVEKQIPFRDPFLAYAVFMYELRHQE